MRTRCTRSKRRRSSTRSIDRNRRSIAAAAAAAVDPKVEAALRGHDVVYLRAAPEVLAARIEHEPDDGHRPFVVDDAARVLAEQFATRDDALLARSRR